MIIRNKLQRLIELYTAKKFTDNTCIKENMRGVPGCLDRNFPFKFLSDIKFIGFLILLIFAIGCSNSAKTVLGQCKFEVDKIMANKVKDSGGFFEKQEEETQIAKLIRSCMEAKGFELDIDKVLKETPFSESEAVNYDFNWKRQEGVLMQKIKKVMK